MISNQIYLWKYEYIYDLLLYFPEHVWKFIKPSTNKLGIPLNNNESIQACACHFQVPFCGSEKFPFSRDTRTPQSYLKMAEKDDKVGRKMY